MTSTSETFPTPPSLPPLSPPSPHQNSPIIPLLLIPSQTSFHEDSKIQATNKKKLVLVLSSGKYYFIIAIHIKQESIVFPIIQSYNAKFS